MSSLNEISFPPAFTVHPEVTSALRFGEPVVALETTLVTHGLPFPASTQAARRAEAAVRAAGATPATIGVAEGRVHVGMTGANLEKLALRAKEGQARKLNAADLATAVARNEWGGTTVSATVAAAATCGIRMFATGGIGGVHRGLTGAGALGVLDISSDLGALASSQVAVISAGAKSILDLPNTLELLEALGVPVWGYRTLEMPAFYVAKSGIALREKADSPAEVAAFLTARWEKLRQTGGVLVVQPPPPHPGLQPDKVEAAIEQAVQRAAGQGIVGPAATPFLLAEVANLLGPAAVEVNVALVEANATLAGQIAASWAKKGH
jgi:pseudouridine-5'-phosphate glycosidase